MRRGALGAMLTTAGLLLAFAGCTTTGDPQQGGLFGWSESKARERQTQRKARVARADADLSRVSAQQRVLQNRETGASRRLAAAETKRADELRRLQILEARLLDRTEQLEATSPTSATASRARSLRVRISSIAAQNSLPIAERIDRLKEIETLLNQATAR